MFEKQLRCGFFLGVKSACRATVCRTVKGTRKQSARPGVRRDGREGRRLGGVLLGG